MKYLFIVLFLYSCIAVGQEIDQDHYMVFATRTPIPGNYDDHFLDSCGQAVLIKPEIDQVMQLYHNCINEYNKNINKDESHDEVEKQRWLIDVKADRYFQLVPATNEHGDKIVWVNCFSAESPDALKIFFKKWRREIIYVEDGGNDFFRFYVNLNKKTYYQLVVNPQG